MVREERSDRLVVETGVFLAVPSIVAGERRRFSSSPSGDEEGADGSGICCILRALPTDRLAEMGFLLCGCALRDRDLREITDGLVVGEVISL